MTEGPYKLPEGWRWVRLGEVCQHRTGIWGPEASNPAQGFPIVRSTEIDGFFIRPQAASVRVVRPGQVDAYKLETGDILVSKSSGSPHLVGWPAIFEDPQDGRIYLFSNFMLRLRSDRRSLEPWFLLYYLHSPIARSIYLGAQDTTSGLRNLRVQEFMAQPIPLPPLDEQRRIVARIEELMARVREAKRLRRQAKEDAERLMQAALAEVFPRPGTEPPTGWRWVRLGEVCEIASGGTPKRSVPAYWGGNIPWVKISDIPADGWVSHTEETITIEGLSSSSAKIFPEGTLLFSIFATVGKVGILRIKAATNQAIAGLRIIRSDIDRRYLFYALGRVAERAKTAGRGMAQDNINLTILRGLPIPLPPLDEQRHIVEHLEAVQEKVKALKEAQAATDVELQRLEQAILDKAFRGEL